jgi:hypothetical protein
MDDAVVKAMTGKYLLLAQEIKDAKAQQEAVKEQLAPYLDNAEPNARGSLVIGFEEPLEVFGQKYKGLQRVRKESKVLNEERVIEYILECTSAGRKDGMVNGIKVLHQTWEVDQDGLWEMFVNDMLTQEELDSFFDTTVTWSFLPTKE